MATTWTITAESTPVLDGWGWADYWTLADWRKWHGLMLTKFGKEHAAKTFTYYWNLQDSDANPYNWGKYDPEFVKYLAAYGIDISNFISKILLGATNVAGAAGDLIGGAGDIGSFIGKHARVIFIVLAVIVVAIVAVQIIKATKTVAA